MKNNSAIYSSIVPGLLLLIIPTILIGVFILLINGCKKEQNLNVTTGHITDITPTSANCIDNAFSGEFGIGYVRGIVGSDIITVPTVPDQDMAFDNNITGSTTGNFSFSLVNLTPGTKYYIRAYVIPFLREPIYGQIISFSTTGSIIGNIVFNPDLTYGFVSDIDGNSYKTIEIGAQTWMAENLKTTKYRDGTGITNVTDLYAWQELTTPAYCWYLNDGAAYKKPYGALYNWYAVNTGKLCPSGWHVPSQTEWTTLTTFLGGDNTAFSKLKETGTTHWIESSADVNNSSGFTGLPGGCRQSNVIPMLYFDGLGRFGYFWSSDPLSNDNWATGSVRLLDGRYSNFYQTTISGKSGCSVRCVKD